MVFFCSNKISGAFDFESLSSFQNSAGAFPSSIYPKYLGALSDPTIFDGNILSYQTSPSTKIPFRISTAWRAWNIDEIPVVRCALQINVSI